MTGSAHSFYPGEDERIASFEEGSRKVIQYFPFTCCVYSVTVPKRLLWSRKGRIYLSRRQRLVLLTYMLWYGNARICSCNDAVMLRWRECGLPFPSVCAAAPSLLGGRRATML
ncbi:hypothetical protein, unlikely [Trypanosoma brucei brucei TREU927]|uniref:Uncharacterized protein n=1 Tax=Trypanosoma brucei brucei (strain 927/4 GUTat10.1) TaxID=185431 RepID=Q38E78_TRYB2|nr:hypothetical protein, unlikely [Trypanosoma brucei brucei TREU927]EAN76892.1 hypothetical protein, unlikely [Trypanosoma brucei brucei TREU927]